MNLFFHFKHIISCGPEIKECFQNKGFSFLSESLALAYAKEKGYTIAVGGVDETIRQILLCMKNCKKSSVLTYGKLVTVKS